MRLFDVGTPVVLVLLLSVSSVVAGELPSFEKSAEKVQAATVTVRVGRTAAKEEAGGATPLGSKVTVFSGVSLGEGHVVTPLFEAENARIRVTLPGGEQADARALVLDEHSGLALLEIDKKNVPGVELAKSMPRVGSWVLSAAAWGVEKPVVSFGIVSGVDRMLPGANYPPLLACDLRTAETSSGAGVVNSGGQLIGIVVAADQSTDQRGWTYAVPVDHVQRLLRANDEQMRQGTKKMAHKLLRRHRPIVGMVLDGNRDTVVVSRVQPNGPADRAGIRQGDQVLSVDGVTIRSVYQAVTPTLFKQPGDRVTFLLKQNNATRSVEVKLGGGDVMPGVRVGQTLAPQVTVNRFESGRLDTGRAQSVVRELFDDGKAPKSADRDPQKWLEEAIQRYLVVIDVQKGKLLHLEGERAKSEQERRTLKAENEALRRQLEQLRQAP